MNYANSFGLWPCPELCAAGVGAVGGGTLLGGLSLGTVATAAAPVTIGLGLVGWAALPVNPVQTQRSIPGALVGADATTVSVGTASLAAKGFGEKLKRGARKTLEAIAIAVGIVTQDQLPPKPDPEKDQPPPLAPTSTKTLTPVDKKDWSADPLQQQ